MNNLPSLIQVLFVLLIVLGPLLQWIAKKLSEAKAAREVDRARQMREMEQLRTGRDPAEAEQEAAEQEEQEAAAARARLEAIAEARRKQLQELRRRQLAERQRALEAQRGSKPTTRQTTPAQQPLQEATSPAPVQAAPVRRRPQQATTTPQVGDPSAVVADIGQLKSTPAATMKKKPLPSQLLGRKGHGMTRADWRRAFILREVFDKPLSMRPPEDA